jgi:hypothetical protein
MAKRLARLRPAALVVAVVVVAAGCGGDDSSSASNDNGASGPTTNGNRAASSSGGTTGNAEYDALLKKAQRASYRITYKSNGSDGEFTISHDPPKSAFLTNDGTQFINDGSRSVMCSDVGTRDAKCYETTIGAGAADSIVQGFFGAYAALLATNGPTAHGYVFDVSKSGQTMAGRDAKCATINGGRAVDRTGQFEVCVDAETGVLLLGQSTTNGKTERIEATSYGDPKPSDFEPASPPTRITLPTVTT